MKRIVPFTFTKPWVLLKNFLRTPDERSPTCVDISEFPALIKLVKKIYYADKGVIPEHKISGEQFYDKSVKTKAGKN